MRSGAFSNRQELKLESLIYNMEVGNLPKEPLRVQLIMLGIKVLYLLEQQGIQVISQKPILELIKT